MATVNLTQTDNGDSVDVKPGDTITISLEENPTTGYRWALDSLEQQIVTLNGDNYTAAGGGIGGGGMRTFTLKAVTPGTAQPAFKLWREWAGDQSVIQRFDVTIHVG